MKSRQEIKQRLVKGVYGNFSEWRQACEEAKANGWTQDEVEHVLNVYHPSTWMLVVIILFCIGTIIFSVVLWNS